MLEHETTVLPRRGFHARALSSLAILFAPGTRAETKSEDAAIGGAGPREDRVAIEAVLHTYLRVMDEQSEASIAQAFHPSAFLMSVTRAGELNAMTQATWWQRISRPGVGKVARTSTIRCIDVVGPAAMARVDVDRSDSTSTDFFTLLRFADGWKIVNKVVSSVIG